ncbi:hypothetical protein [Marilutibacter chinensis]|uniref:TubC N-terminal docking domain-containing protein n=1 Tax=Marilutibacter chinensis TaxID=2912247 RepID=A0ABS9HQ20_9GAMM|nr:hypothetical protein [Lysobacter chinensis]MCF7221041.1 hypothetical protein [Lysobacter chinensis]
MNNTKLITNGTITIKEAIQRGLLDVSLSQGCPTIDWSDEKRSRQILDEHRRILRSIRGRSSRPYVQAKWDARKRARSLANTLNATPMIEAPAKPRPRL